jgi:hypothetical protein
MNNLPAEFSYSSRYVVADSSISFKKISASDDFMFAIYSNSYQDEGVKDVVITPAQGLEEADYLSTLLGVDESVRKLVSEIAPKSIKGVVIVNGHRGVLCVVTRPPGGSTGQAGVIRTVEFLYKFPAETYSDKTRLVVFPVVYEEDFELYPRDVFEVVRDFSLTFMKEIQLINNKRFTKIFDLYDEVRQSLETVGNYVERVNKEFYDQLLRSNTEGLMFNEFPLLRIQTMLESTKNALKSQPDIKMRYE